MSLKALVISSFGLCKFHGFLPILSVIHTCSTLKVHRGQIWRPWRVLWCTSSSPYTLKGFLLKFQIFFQTILIAHYSVIYFFLCSFDLQTSFRTNGQFVYDIIVSGQKFILGINQGMPKFLHCLICAPRFCEIILKVWI